MQKYMLKKSLSLGYILDILFKFGKFQPHNSYKEYFYKNNNNKKKNSERPQIGQQRTVKEYKDQNETLLDCGRGRAGNM